MCGRFFIAEDGENELLEEIIQEAARRQQAVTGVQTVARGEICPGTTAAALAMGKNGRVGAFPMQWGFRRPGGKGLIVNVRSETALDKPLFRESMQCRRCLIPASWYFEWEKRNGQQTLPDAVPSFQIQGDAPIIGRGKHPQKIKYAIRPRNSGLIYLAAIYRYEDAQRLPVFSILTRQPAPEIAFIHDRMPVIFSDAARGIWLDRAADPQEALKQCEKEMVFRAV